MYHINASKERLKAVEILTVPGLFTIHRVDRATLPRGCTSMKCRATPTTGASPACWGGISRWSTSAPCSPPALSLCRPAAIWTWPRRL